MDWMERCIEEIKTILYCVRELHSVGGTIPLFTTNYEEAKKRASFLRENADFNNFIPKVAFEGIIEQDDDELYEGLPHYRITLMLINRAL
jgi:hypothetical protein